MRYLSRSYRFLLFALLFLPSLLFSQDLLINEFLADNETNITDESGEFADWVEIYNPSNIAIDMAGMYLTDDLEEPNLWQVPYGFSNKTTIAPGEYLLFWFDKDLSEGPLHVNAKLKSGGEQIGLFNADLSPIDQLTYGEQIIDVSYGRDINNISEWISFPTPTPLAENAVSLPQAEAPIFSIGSGQYESAIILHLSNNSGLNIFYTIDGSQPTPSDILYQEPISIDSSMTIRAISTGANYIASDASSAYYLIGVNHDFPIVYLAFDPFDFYDPETGIYVNYLEDWERPADVTLFETDGSIAFSQPARVEIQGTASAEFEHKSISIKAKKYNDEKLFDYPIFDDLPYDKYGSFIIRNSGQDWNLLAFRDAYGVSLVDDLSDVGNIIDKPQMILQGYRPAVGYFNGEYRGIYNIRERLDKRYFKTHFGLSKDDYDLIKNADVVKSGDITYWNEYMNFLLLNNMSIDANYDSLQNLMDVDAYIDYITLNIFINNHDWPGNNVRRYKEKTPEGKWRWMVYDLDFSFSLMNEDGSWNTGNFQDNALSRLHTGLDWEWPNTEWGTRPFRACIQNNTWRTKFINRMADQLNVLYDPARLQSRMDEFVVAYEPEMDAYACKWFGCWSEWETNINKVENFISGRAPVVRNHFVQQYGEVTGMTDVTLLANPIHGGTIEFSTINLDASHFPWNGIYFAGVDIPVKATPAPGYEFVGWSDSNLGTNESSSVRLFNGSYSLTANFQLINNNNSDLTIFCPADIYLTTNTLSAYANWLSPEATTTCSAAGGAINVNQTNGLPAGSEFPIGTTVITYQANDACGNLVNCSFSINVTETNIGGNCDEISGYTKLGEFNNHGYYLSENSSTWVDAAEQTNGQLMSIESPSENNFLLGLVDSPVFIGINDEQSEGNLLWTNGSDISYTNFTDYDWYGLNTADNDYGTFLNWDGTWGFGNQWIQRPHILEKTCEINSTFCPTYIEGFTTLGIYNNHTYFLSENKLAWNQAKLEAENQGGYLTTINTQSENDFIQENINEMVFIGYNDSDNEGFGQWANGESLSFDLSLNNSQEGDFATINFWAGTWSLNNQFVHKKYILEMDCAAQEQSYTRRLFGPKGIKLHSIYPNPANDFITLRLFANTFEEIQFSIINPQGQLKHLSKDQLPIGSNEIDFDIQTLPPGVYFLKATGLNTDQTLRFVKLKM